MNIINVNNIMFLIAIILLTFIIFISLYFSNKEFFTKNNETLFPITFSIPEEKIVKNISIKTHLLSRIIPGETSTSYDYTNENDYYNEYKTSYFAYTKKKGGWDCLRHYEICANGCLVYFPELKDCPKNTMSLLPKNLFEQSNELFKKIVNNDNPEIKSYLSFDITKISDENKKIYNNLVEETLNYFKNNLTCSNMANYILNKTNNNNIQNVLYLPGDDMNPEYLSDFTLIGFKQLFKNKCHDYPKRENLYDDYKEDTMKLYGRGFTYTKVLHSSLHDKIKDESIENDIKNHSYDIIIYSVLYRSHEQLPYDEIIQKYYKPHEIILLDGEDTIRNREYFDKYTKRGNYVFVRELE